VEERLEAANELLSMGEQAGDERLVLAGHRWRMMDLLELGDIDSADIEMDAFARIAERRRRVSDTLYVHIYRSMRLLLAGEFDQAEAEGHAAVVLGNRVQDPNTGNATLLQACTLRRERGRLERLEGPVRAYAERFHSIPGWVCVLAHLLAETGRHDEAREILDAFAADDFKGLPLDGIWLGAVAYLAETAAAIGDPTHAEALHDLLEPYADRNVAVGWASTCTGSAARHLGLLADLLGRRKQAIAYFEQALAMNERMRARPWVARTQVELARALGPRSKRSAELLEAGLATAQELGMPRLIERAEGAAVTP
jgi:tetratricopeptide (TPR) repeat protein